MDGGDTGGADIEATGASAVVTIDAVTGVGAAGAIDTKITTLDLDNTGSGNVDINETDALNINQLRIQDAAAGTVNVDAGGTITVVAGQAGVSALAGQVELDANGIDSSIAVNATILTTSGVVHAYADNDATFGAAGAITSTTGNVLVTADEDGLEDSGETDRRRSLTMTDGAVINAGSGTITLSAHEDVTLGRLVTTNNTGSAVGITSLAGGLVDSGDTGGEDIEATGASAIVTIDAVTGVVQRVPSIRRSRRWTWTTRAAGTWTSTRRMR